MGSMQAAIRKGASYDEEARFLFDIMQSATLDDGVDEHSISLQDLCYVLLQYNLPASEAKLVMAKYDSNHDGKLNFEEFKRGFRPLIKFQVRTRTLR